jgi:VanZ family protein
MKTKAIRNTFLSAVIMMVSGVFFASAQESGETFRQENKYKEVSEKAVYCYDFSGNIVYHNMSKKNINIFEQFILTN